VKATRVRRQRGTAYLFTRSNGGNAFYKASAPLIVTITRVAPGTLDSDGVVSSQKAVRDGIADALGIDDGSSRIDWRYGQRKGSKGQYAVEIRIETAAP